MFLLSQIEKAYLKKILTLNNSRKMNKLLHKNIKWVE